MTYLTYIINLPSLVLYVIYKKKQNLYLLKIAERVKFILG